MKPEVWYKRTSLEFRFSHRHFYVQYLYFIEILSFVLINKTISNNIKINCAEFHIEYKFYYKMNTKKIVLPREVAFYTFMPCRAWS